MVQRAAQLGFAAAAVAYRSLDFNLFYPDRMDAKERCVFGTSSANVISQLCANQGPLASSATKIDCTKGIAVAGHSQGGLMPLMAKNYDSRVVAAYTLGIGIYYDPSRACSADLLGCNFVNALFPRPAPPLLAAALPTTAAAGSSCEVRSSIPVLPMLPARPSHLPRTRAIIFSALAIALAVSTAVA